VTTRQCQEDIVAAMNELIAEGVEVIILGCTELPLLFPLTDFTRRNGARVRLIDPTDVLARQCVAYVSAAAAPTASPLLAAT
jgi:aspartate racemase